MPNFTMEIEYSELCFYVIICYLKVIKIRAEYNMRGTSIRAPAKPFLFSAEFSVFYLEFCCFQPIFEGARVVHTELTFTHLCLREK